MDSSSALALGSSNLIPGIDLEVALPSSVKMLLSVGTVDEFLSTSVFFFGLSRVLDLLVLMLFVCSCWICGE